MNKEKEIKSIMRDVECTQEEAEEIWQIEQKAKANGSTKLYAQSDKQRTKVKREIKPDSAKITLITRIAERMTDKDIENLAITNLQREITFIYEDAEYSIILTKHRPKKEK